MKKSCTYVVYVESIIHCSFGTFNFKLNKWDRNNTLHNLLLIISLYLIRIELQWTYEWKYYPNIFISFIIIKFCSISPDEIQWNISGTKLCNVLFVSALLKFIVGNHCFNFKLSKHKSVLTKIYTSNFHGWISVNR